MASFAALQVFTLFLAVTTAQKCIDNFKKFDADQTTFLMIAMQESFESGIKNFDLLVETANKMITAARILDIPVFASKLDSKRYGNIVSSIKLGKTTVFSTNTFSVWARLKTILSPATKNIFIFGIETHIDIEQTARDMVKEGYQVTVVLDGSSSRSLYDRRVAIERLRLSGVYIGTSEAILYNLVGTTRNPDFPEIYQLNRKPVPDTFEED